MSKDRQEGAEVKFFSIGVGLNDGNDICGLAFHVKSSDGIDDFFHRDLSAVVVVEQIEDFFELLNSLDVHALVGVFSGVESLHVNTFTLDMIKVSRGVQ